MSRIWVYLSCATLATMLPYTASAQDSTSDPLMQDAQAIAQKKGISTQEALRRLVLQNKVNALSQSLAADPGFVGTDIESTPTSFKIRIRLARSSVARALTAPAMSDPSLARVVQFETGGISRADTDRLEDAALSRFAALKMEVALKSDIRSGRIIVQTREPEQAKKALEALGIANNFSFEKRVEFARPVVDLRGGERFTVPRGTCTSGFGASFSSTTGILSGGHCVRATPGGTPTGTTATLAGATLDIRGSVWDATRDFMWASRAGNVGRNQVFDGSRNRSITSAFTGTVANGTSLCKYGIATGYTCQDVVNNNYRGVDSAGNQVGPVIELGGTSANIAQCGDSGGPVFTGGIAHGIISRGDARGSCQGGSTLIYVPLRALSGLGVTVLTS